MTSLMMIGNGCGAQSDVSVQAHAPVFATDARQALAARVCQHVVLRQTANPHAHVVQRRAQCYDRMGPSHCQTRLPKTALLSNELALGQVETGRIRQYAEDVARREGRSLQDVEHNMVASIPTGRFGRPEEFAAQPHSSLPNKPVTKPV
jgi:hypothetical protein